MKKTIITLFVRVDESTEKVDHSINAHEDLPLDLLIDAVADALNTLHKFNRIKPGLTFKELPNAKPIQP
jgi:hypothetical protein